MKKQSVRVLCLLLSIAMLFSLLPVSAFAADVPEDGGISTQADGELTISGYTRVTELPADGLAEGKYLIIAKYGENYYMFYPGATGGVATTQNSARLVVANGVATGYQVGYGTAYDSAAVSTDFTAAENSIIKDYEDNAHTIASSQFGGGQEWDDYTVAAFGPNNTRYSLFVGSTACYGAGKSGVTLIGAAPTAGYFRLRNTANNNAQLIFLNTSAKPWMNFNQSGGVSADTDEIIVDMMFFKSNAAYTRDADLAPPEQTPDPNPPILPGYTQITRKADLDESKGYLIVSQDAQGNFYALYPSEAGETLPAADLPVPGDSNDGARTAELAVSGNTVTATWLKDGSDLEMENLLFTINKDGKRYVFTAFNGRHLNMENQMFTEGSVSLAITSRGVDAHYAFKIENAAAGRNLDFTKTGDPNAFYSGASQSIDYWGTDFWCPKGTFKMPIYLFESNVKAPTVRDRLQDLVDELSEVNNDDGRYIRASWRAFQAALDDAQSKIDDPSIDDNAKTLLDALSALENAYKSLRSIPTVPEGAAKLEVSQMIPAKGTSQNQPFISGADGTAGSANFRIPAMITLQHQSDSSKNGRLVAAIDARWNHAGDACALDTIVSYSDDNGFNWNYNFANYFGDSTNNKQSNATAFIDPVIVEGSDGTIYLMVDLWPGGVALNTAPMRPAASTGYVEIDGTKRLVLYTSPATSGQTDDNWAYYVGDFAGDYAPVMERLDDDSYEFSGFYVDKYYYLYSTSGNFEGKTPANDKIWCERLGGTSYVQQNVFFYNATLHARNASYLWIVTSADGGESWSAPIMINDQVRTGADQFYGVGPGAGLCVETDDGTGAIPNGMIILPVYTWSTERAGFIYSADDGVTWKRGPNATTNHSSESCLVQINDTTIRHFYRDTVVNKVRYTDHTWTGDGWTTAVPVETTAAKDGTGTQLSAIKYSGKINGKDVIILSTPGSGARRTGGLIHVFLVNDNVNHTMELYNTYKVTDDGAYYCYSSLTETADGDIALLYEHAAAAVTFTIFSISDLAPTLTLTVTGYEGDYDGEPHSVAVITSDRGATVQYSTDGGTTWNAPPMPAYTDKGTYTVMVRATLGDITREGAATVKINQAHPTISITSDKGTVLKAGDEAVFTITGVPSKVADVDAGTSVIDGAITLTCSNTDPGHDGNITLTRQDDGTYTGAHDVVEGQHTFTASYHDSNGNYADASATYSVTVAPAGFEFTAKDYTCTYDGQPHSIIVTKGDDITVTYCETEDGVYTSELPGYTNAGTYTTYYMATNGTETVTGSANVTIGRATPVITFSCGHEGHDESHDILDSELPLRLTISGVPAADQGKFTITTYGDALENVTRNPDGTLTAAPALPPVTRTYTFTAVFDPTQTQEGAAIEVGSRNYNRATAEITVNVTRSTAGTESFNFSFAGSVVVDENNARIGTYTVVYDGEAHDPLPALVYNSELVELKFHVPSGDVTGDPVWTDVAPSYTEPGEYTVTCLATLKGTSRVHELTVVLKIDDSTDIPTRLALTPSAATLNGGGTLTLTVGRAPAVGALTVTCDHSVQITETARGKYSVELPNANATYTFTVNYAGAGSYQPATASCKVSVTADGDTFVPVVPENPTPDTTTTTTTNPDGSTTTTVTDNKTGAVTETTTDPEGGKVEKVTTSEKDVTVTVTDAEGEVLAKVEIPAEMPAVETRFVDVPEGHWADEAIHNMAALEVVDGVGGDRYNMNGDMTRGALATVLRRMSNGQEGLEANFTDVDSDEWYADGIAWAARVGVVTGRSADTFAPDDTITREELAVMLCRYARLLGIDTTADSAALDSFNDGSSTHSWAADSIAWCVDKGILKGMGNDTLAPTATATRAQVAVMLQRFIDLMK